MTTSIIPRTGTRTQQRWGPRDEDDILKATLGPHTEAEEECVSFVALITHILHSKRRVCVTPRASIVFVTLVSLGSTAQGEGHGGPDVGFRTQGSEFRVQGSGSRFYCPGVCV